jgi:hypothetical protein
MPRKKPKKEEPQKVDLAVVLGYIAVKDTKTLEGKVATLNQLGFSNREMALICGTKENAIRAAKSNLGLSPKKRSKKKGEKNANVKQK